MDLMRFGSAVAYDTSGGRLLAGARRADTGRTEATGHTLREKMTKGLD